MSDEYYGAFGDAGGGWTPEDEADESDLGGGLDGLNTYIVVLRSLAGTLVKAYTVWAESEQDASAKLRDFFEQTGFPDGLDTASHTIQFGGLESGEGLVADITDFVGPKKPTFEPGNN